MKYSSVCVLVAALAVLSAAPARAEREVESASPPPVTPPVVKVEPARAGMFAAASAATARKMTAQQREERHFLKDAAAASRFEGEAARLALSRSNDPGVRSFAATLINHHASAGPALQHLLHARGMAPPMLSNEQRKVLNRLAKLGGPKFDREFMDEVGMKVQQEDLLLHERAAQGAADPALKAWVARTLPTLRYHLALAERLAGHGEIRQAKSEVRPAKGDASRIAVQRPGAGQYKSAVPHALPSRPETATQFMGAGPMQLGVTRPVAASPTESNNR